MTEFVVCSYYTFDTPYQQVAHECLMPSLFEAKIPADVRGVQSLGSWGKNTSYKPTFIKRMLTLHPDKNVVFLDADAQVMLYPELFGEIPEEFNIAVHILDKDRWYNRKNGGEQELLSGTLFVRNCEASHKILDRWIHLCAVKHLMWEQKILQEVIDEMGIPIYELPISYCYIRTMPDGSDPHVKCEKPVVVHHQCSRLYKRDIK